MRMRAYRAGYPSRRRPLFLLNVSTYRSVKRRYGWTDLTISVLTGMDYASIKDYARGVRGGKRRQIRAIRERAARISQAMRCDFSQLWSEA